MTLSSFRRRSLTHHWRTNLGVVLGVIAGSAALTGALLVGDSLRGSLRETALARLQRIDAALRTDRLLRASLANDVRDLPDFASRRGVASAILMLQGSATHAESKARAGRVEILGVDDDFWKFSSANQPRPPNFDANAVALNDALAGQLGASVGDEILLRFEKLTAVSSETLMGRRDDRSVTLRVRVAAILPDDGLGGVALTPRQHRPLNAIIPIASVQRALDAADRANTLLLADAEDVTKNGRGTSDALALLKPTMRLEDLGLQLRANVTRGYLSLESVSGLLPPASETSARAVASHLKTPASGILSYLANELRVVGKEGAGTPYSTVAAIEASSPLMASLCAAANLPEGGLNDGEIVLNKWTADDLDAHGGDRIEMAHYVTGEFGKIETHKVVFTLRGVVPLEGIAGDPGLVPEYKGVTDTKHIADWDPPFPVDLKRVRDKDEQYWERHRTTPKAFITLADGRKLWAEHEERFGRLTSVRVQPPTGEELSAFAASFERELLNNLKPGDMGIRFEPVREVALRVSQGATDFGGLFIGFSFFLIVSAAMLVALLFRLGVERRVAEFGTLLAVGFSPMQVFRMLAAEGAVLSLIGSAIGLLVAAGYASLMLTGLRTQWSAAVNAPFLRFHFTWTSLAIGLVASFLVAMISIAIACRGLSRLPPRALMAGQTGADSVARRTRRRSVASTVGLASLVGGLALLAAGAVERVPQAAGFFGGASLLLIAALAAVRWRMSSEPRNVIHRPGALSEMRLAWRNARRAPGRSVMIVSLLACATFLIAAIGAFRIDPIEDVDDRTSGTGGFSLYAESAIPLVYDLNTPDGREQLGVSATSDANLDKVNCLPFRLRRGDDTSCLNLYQRNQPRILGVTRAMIARGGFRFTEQGPANRWALLDQALPDGVIPAIGDEAAVKWQLHSGLGQDFTIADEHGRAVKLRFVALLAGSVLQDELVISEANFTRLFPSISGYSFFLIDTAAVDEAGAGTSNPKSKIQNPESDLEHVLERGLADYGFDAAPTRDRLRDYLAVQNTYLSTFQSLGGVGLLLGSLGMSAVLLRSVWERRRELALLRATGFAPSRVTFIVIAENVGLVVVGLAAGLLPALLAVIPVSSVRGATIPWTSLAATLACALLAAIVVGWLALRTTLRGSIVRALSGD